MQIKERIGIGLLILLAAVVYSTTLAPSVIQIDSGELAAVAIKGGIAHPSGYPLFTMLGYVFSKIPLGISGILKMNILSLLYCLGGLVFFWLFVRTFLEHFRIRTAVEETGKKRSKRKQAAAYTETAIGEDIRWVAALAGTGLLAFSQIYWIQSTSVEVYSLHVMLISLSLYFLTRAYYSDSDSINWWLALSVSLALGFGNHLTTFVLLPGVAVLFFHKFGFRKASLLNLGLMLTVFFTLLALIYSYLPLRAAENPLFNWGDPDTFEYFLRHASGKQYRVWMFSSTAVAAENLATFFGGLPRVFAWAGMIPVLAGVVFSFKGHKVLSAFLLTVFFSTILYAINYDIHDISNYFLPAYIICALWAVLGFAWGSMLILRKVPNIWMHTGIAAVLVGFMIFFNYKKTDQSDLYTFSDYPRFALESLPENALLVSYQWDYLISPSYYFQHVEGVRPDVTLVDKELLRRSWYYDQLDRFDPEVLSGLEKEREAFISAVLPFERGDAFNSKLLSQLFLRINSGIISQNVGLRPVFLAPEVQGELKDENRVREIALPKGYQAVPHLFFFQVVKDTAYVPLPALPDLIRFPKSENIYVEKVKRIMGEMLTYRILYELYHTRNQEAKATLAYFQALLPGFQGQQDLVKMVEGK